MPFVAVQHYAENHDDGEGEESLRPWDLSKTLIVEWPTEEGSSSLSVAYEASYHEQQESLKP